MAEKILNKNGLKITTTELKEYIDNASPEPSYTPTTASDFKFNNNVITAYTGNATEIVIPRSYSIESQTITVNGALLSPTIPTTGSFPSLPDTNLQLTFTDGINSATARIGYWLGGVTSWDGLQNWFSNNFDGTPTLTYATGSQYSLIALCFADNVGDAFLQFPVTVNSQTFNNATDLSTYCGTLSSPYDLDFSGEHEVVVNAFVDGTDYNVTEIGDSASFANKTSIKKLVILNNITRIGSSVFSSATNLESLVFEKNSTLTEIASQAFQTCRKLGNVEFPESLTTIGSQAFYNNGFTGIYIPKNVTSISANSFRSGAPAYVSQIVKIEVDPANQTYDSRNNCNCLIETATNKIIQGCCNSTIPNTIETIGTYSFGYCNITKSLTIPSSVTTIESYAFSYSTLTSVSMYARTIGQYAFQYCKNLSSLTLNSGIETIEQYAFQYCSSLGTVSMPNTITSIGGHAFYYCTGIRSLTLSSSLTTIGYNAFRVCSGLTTINVPASVTSMSATAFAGCTSLQTANLYLTASSYTLSSATSGWFFGCNSSLKLHIPSSVTSPNTAYGGQYWRYYSTSGTLTYTADL